MKITIFGTGYVGLITGACFANVGHEVLCVDIDKKRIDDLKKGIMPIFEPGLESILKKNIKKSLKFTNSVNKGITHGKVCFITLGTPSKEDGSINMDYFYGLVKEIGRSIKEYKLVVNKSTVPVGTAKKSREIISHELKKRQVKVDFDICSNPEFLKEGNAIEDFVKPERIIVGCENEKSKSIINECYASFNRQKDKMIYMDLKSAELTKYAANAMLATKISFMNEMSRLSEKLGADIEQVRLGIGSDSRIGYQFIYPGCGYGGSCFPKDIRGAIKTAENVGYDMKILKAVDEVNNKQKEVLFEKLISHFDNNLKGKKISIWGLSFKPGTDDLREAPSLVLINSILKAGGEVFAHDPESAAECKKIYSSEKKLNINLDHYDCLENSEALIICTEWKIYRQVDLQRLKDLMINPVIIDGRNIFSKELMSEEKIPYISIGRN
jgi:UDPglucose 6-dehydrogenase